MERATKGFAMPVVGVAVTVLALIVVAAVSYFTFGYKPVCGSDALWNGRRCVPVVALLERCDSLPAAQGRFCSEIIRKRNELFRNYSEARRPGKTSARHMARRVYVEAYRTVATAKHSGKTRTKVLCKIRDNRRIHCVPLTSLLAFYDQSMGEAILSDIEVLVSLAKHLDPRRQVLADCGDGLWLDAETESSEGGDALASLSPEVEKRLIAGCDVLRQASSGRGGSGPGGFSGLTGIDLFGSDCLGDVGANQTTDFIEKAMAFAEEMAKQCEATVAETMMEGDESDATTDSDDSSSSSSGTTTSTEVVTNNGDGTETVTTTDSEGNTTSYVRYDATMDGGSTGAGVGRVETQTRSDGSTVVTKSSNADGSGISTQRATNADGSWWEVTRLPSGLMISRDSDGKHDIGGPGTDWARDCMDEACSSCKDFMEFYPDLIASCWGEDPRTCSEFARTAECCSNPSAFPVDPRVVTPNPLGDLVCVGEQDVDVKRERCEETCKVAGTAVAAVEGDCYSDCMARERPAYEWSVMDGICIYAYSEECFGSGRGPSAPTRNGGAPDPFPMPFAVASHVMLGLPSGDVPGLGVFPQ